MSDGYQEVQKVLEQYPQARLLAVSKLQSEQSIQALYYRGQRLFGENYVQELRDKISHLNLPSLEWHFIGRLQKNKIKYILEHVHLFHGVDTLELALAIDHEVAKKNLPPAKILMQINIGAEATKAGFDTANASKNFTELLTLKNIQVEGLMCLPPLAGEASENRKYFIQLRQLLGELQKINTRPQTHSMKELSMGTSHDYQVALQEGATIVRLGTLIFGERPT